jgi:hypothetical protein
MNLAIYDPEALCYETIVPWIITYGGLEFVKKKSGLLI